MKRSHWHVLMLSLLLGLANLLLTVVIKPNFQIPNIQVSLDISSLNPRWRLEPVSPGNCTAIQNMALIVPFRNREGHLKLFLAHMHPFLMKQKLAYTIFVINQTDLMPFNRAMLMNVGYIEAKKRSAFDCFVFHDVDLLPENERNLYACLETPRHLPAAINKFNYSLPYNIYFGGAIALTEEHMERINGFSNQFWGWGGEDDDTFRRVITRKLRIRRNNHRIGRYTMLKHNQAGANEDRHQLLNDSVKARDLDGLNNLEYVVSKATERPFHTEIQVKLKIVEWNNSREAI